MAREALYFPTIRVPHSDWFLQALLYWDRVCAIVPDEAQTPGLLGWRMQNYIEAGLVRLISPDTYVKQRFDFAEELLEDVETSPQLQEMTTAFREGKFDLLHSGKADGRFFDRLAKLGVASFDQGPEWASWWRVESSVATRYMAALARVIASSKDESAWAGSKPVMDPVTDSADHLAALFDMELAFVGRVNVLRTELLDIALPRVSGPLVADDIARFKEQNSALLTDFRSYLTDKVNEIAAEGDAALRKAKADALQDELDGRLKAIAEQLSASQWKADKKGSILRIGASVLKGGASGALSGGASIPGDAAEVATTVKGVLKATTGVGEVGPLAYAAGARQTFGSG